jgi:hypothetical protein
VYGVLASQLGGRWAEILTPLWYALLIGLVLYSAFEPNAGFKYLAV